MASGYTTKRPGPRTFMTKFKTMDVYDAGLKYVGKRVVYKHLTALKVVKYYIMQKNNKAYEVKLKKLGDGMIAVRVNIGGRYLY